MSVQMSITFVLKYDTGIVACYVHVAGINATQNTRSMFIDSTRITCNLDGYSNLFEKCISFCCASPQSLH